MRTLIVHPKDQSTDFLKPIYSPLTNKTIITGGVTKSELRELIETHDRVIMLGHGSPFGLLSILQFPKASNYIIDWSVVDLLCQKTDNIYIWCHADKFVKMNRLKGFCSGMFISEVSEAFSWGYFVANTKLIDESNDLFAETVSKYIIEPLDIMYQNVIQEYGVLAKTNPIADFNLERLYINSDIKKTNSICTTKLI